MRKKLELFIHSIYISIPYTKTKNTISRLFHDYILYQTQSKIKATQNCHSLHSEIYLDLEANLNSATNYRTLERSISELQNTF